MENFLDITGSELVEIRIKHDGKVIWINTEEGCVLRICRIEELIILDDRKRGIDMKVNSLQELRKYVDGVQKSLNVVVGFLAEDGIIADIGPIPIPEKKIRKKRVRKETLGAPTTVLATPEEPKRGRRGRKKGLDSPFGEPQLREGETPI